MMKKKSDDTQEKDIALPEGSRCTENDETADISLKCAGKSPPKGEKSAMENAQQSDCVGQSQSGTVECHTLDAETTGEKRPLEIRYQHHNLRSRLKKVKKDPPVKVVKEPVAPTKKEQAKQSRSPRGEKAEAKPVKKVKRRLKRWEAWSVEDTDDFFEALCEHGRDFESIQKHIEHRHRKRNKGLDKQAKGVTETSKNKDQVRHFYYRTVNKVTKSVDPREDLNMKDRELHALINYGELRRKLKGVNSVPSHKQWRKLSELVNNGVATLRVSGRNMRLRTPVCKALSNLEDNPFPGMTRAKQERPQKLPSKVTIDLRPCDNATWSAVQSMSYNPRIRMNVCIQKKLASLIRVLSSRMIPDNINTETTPKSDPKSEQNIEADMLFELPEKTTVHPYEKVCGRYIIDGGRTLVKLKPEQIPEGYRRKTEREDEAKEVVKDEVKDEVKPEEGKEDGPNIVAALEVKEEDNEENPDEKISLPPGSPQGGVQAPPASSDILSKAKNDIPFPAVGNSPVKQEGVTAAEDTTSSSLPGSTGGSPRSEVQGAKKGALVKSQKTGTVVGSTILMPPVPESDDFMKLTSISDVNILQGDDDEDDDESSKEATAESGSGEEAGKTGEAEQPEEEEENVFKTKDELLQEGLTVSNSDHISLAEVYLMLGKPEKVKFGYRILGQKAERWRTSSLLSKLVMIAKEEAEKAKKDAEKKFVSVGTNTSPAKEKPCHSKPQAVAPQSGDLNLCYQTNGPTATPVFNQNGQLTLQIGPRTTLTRIAPNQTIEVSTDKRKDFQFARPLAPAQVINQRIVNPNIQSVNGNATLSNAYLMPRKRRTGRGRQPSIVASQLFLHQKRPIQPRPAKIVRAVPTGVPVNLAVSSDQHVNKNIDILSRAAIKANIAPMKTVQGVRIMKKSTTNLNNNQELIGLSPLATGPGVVKVNNICQSDPNHSSAQLHSPPSSITMTPDTRQATISNPLSSNPGNLWTLDNLGMVPLEASTDRVHSPTPGPVTSTPGGASTQSDSPRNLSVPVFTISTSADPVLTSTMSTPKTTPERTTRILLDTPLSTPTSTARGLDNSLLNTPVIHDKLATPSALGVSPPNISTFLDMSLPSMDGPSQDNILSGFRERLEELTNQQSDESSAAAGASGEAGSTTTVPMSVAAALTTTKISVPKGGDQSPFKAGGGNQWLHEESSQNTQMSLGTLLDQLEMSNMEKKSTTAGSTAPIAPPLTHNEFSRDSVMSMDSHLHAMLNENSLDYVAKFADLAAHIAASGTEDSPESFTGQLLQTEQTVAR